jgi:hypothetical protein
LAFWRQVVVNIKNLNETLRIERARLFQSAVRYVRNLLDVPMTENEFEFHTAVSEKEGYLYLEYVTGSHVLKLGWWQTDSEPRLEATLFRKGEAGTRETLASTIISDTNCVPEISHWLVEHLIRSRYFKQ